MTLGLVASGMPCEQFRQPDRFLTELLPDQSLSNRCLVAFVEKEVQSLQDPVEARCQLFPSRNLEDDTRRADPLFGSCQPLGNCRFGGQKGARDFSDTEPAECSQCERHLSFPWNLRMTANEHHAQAVVVDFVF